MQTYINKKSIEELPYEEFDNNGKRFQHYAEKIEIAHKLGYSYVSEALCKLYVLHEYSGYDVGDLFGIKRTAVYYRLKQWGIKLRHQGGAAHFTKTFTVANALRDLKSNWTGGTHELYREASRQFGLGFHTIKNFYVHDLWKEPI